MTVEFTEDRSFFIEPANTPTGTGNTYNKNGCTGLTLDLTDPGKGMFRPGTQSRPNFGAYHPTESSQNGGYDGTTPQGWSRWMGYAGTSSAPYRECTVIGAKYEFRVEQLHNKDLTAGNGSKTMACMHWIDKRFDSASASNVISELQNIRNIRQSNMVCLHDQNDSTVQVNPIAQQTAGSGTYSCKKFWGITDIKDNMHELGGQYQNTETWTGPINNAYLHIAFLDRIEGQLPAGYVLPALLVRVKVKQICLLTQPNATSNWTSATVPGTMDVNE
jgi:hypothetical protein